MDARDRACTKLYKYYMCTWLDSDVFDIRIWNDDQYWDLSDLNEFFFGVFNDNDTLEEVWKLDGKHMHPELDKWYKNPFRYKEMHEIPFDYIKKHAKRVYTKKPKRPKT